LAGFVGFVGFAEALRVVFFFVATRGR